MNFAYLFLTLNWSVITISIYAVSKLIHQKINHWWSSPIIMTPLTLGIFCLAAKIDYETYQKSTSWLMMMIGPATVAFAVPIYEQRFLIKKFYKILVAAVICGSIISVSSIIFLSSVLNLDSEISLSLVPHSVTTPFAIEISDQIGGKKELTAIFVAMTGVIGSLIGGAILYSLPLKSKLARGSAFGISSHAVGSNKAYKIDHEEGAIAALAMIMVGIFVTLMTPIILKII
jgi:putative effector of murein hydrolase